ncbi:MAG: DUF2190 family protein [Planctomycetota bacterium]
MAKAKFLHGSPNMIDYTPASAVSAGDVIIEGNAILIAHSDIASGELGAVSDGGGVYAIVKGSSTTAANGAPIHWDVADQEINADGANPQIGRLVEAAVSGLTTGKVRHSNQTQNTIS